MVELLYDNFTLNAKLENASSVSPTQELNQVWTASFELPYNDEKLALCRPRKFLRIYDETNDYGLYRIIPRETEHSATGKAKILCEHVIATLIDDVLFKYTQIGNLGVYTREVIEFVLSKQTTKHWELDYCAFNRQFEYGWENETLLSALHSIPKPITDQYRWEYDTSVYPWRLSLTEVDMNSEPKAYFRYGKNVKGIVKKEDSSTMFNRIYPLGYGEGDNQLTIESVNGGVPYLEDVESIKIYGPISSIWVDRRFEIVENLFERAKVLLKSGCKPRLEYTLDAIDLFPITSDPLDQPRVGDVIRVIDDELGEDFKTVITAITRPNVFKSPGEVTITVSNQPQDLAGTISELANRANINDTQAQGATNSDTQNFVDNADASHPAVLRFWVDDSAVRINKIMLVYTLENFRGYTKGAQSTVATSATSSTQPTTTPTSSTQPTSSPTSASSGYTSSSTQNSPATGDSTAYGGSGNSYMTAGASTRTTTVTGGGIDEIRWTEWIDAFDSTKNRHRHQYGDSTLLHSHDMDHTHNITISFPSHTHSFTIPSHSHSFTVQAHTHTVTIAAHSHTITISAHSHTVTIPAHTHNIEHGIYDGPRASSAAVYVDGTLVPMVPNQQFDIAPYLGTDSSGRITRGTFHIVQIVPDNLTRITATGVSQIFLQSRGGGDY